MNHRKGRNQEQQYNIRKKKYLESQQPQEDPFQYGRSNNQDNRNKYDKRRPQRTYDKPRRNDPMSMQNLLNMAKGGNLNKGLYQTIKFVSPRLENASKQAPPPNNIAKINRQQNAQLKQGLDAQLSNYMNSNGESSSVRQKSQGGARGSNNNEAKEDWSEDMSIAMDKTQNNNESYVQGGTIPAKKEKSQKKAALDQGSDWLNNDQDDNNTSEPNIQKILTEENFPTIDAKNQPRSSRKRQQQSIQQKNIGVKRQSSTGAKVEESMSIDQSSCQISKSQQQSLISDPQDLNRGRLDQPILSHLIDEQGFQNETHFAKKQIEQQPQVSEEELKTRMQSLKKDDWLKVSLTFQAYDNIMQLKIKQVQLVKLEAMVKISSNGKTSLFKYPDISQQQIEKYITFKNTAHTFPRMLFNLPEDSPSAVQGDQQCQPARKCNRIQLQLCMVRGAEPEQEKGKIDKSIILLRSVEVSCMECMAVNKIVIVQSTDSVMGSCRSCSTKIYGKLAVLQFST